MKLYKYMPVSSGNALKSLTEGYIWFSSPESFNDPYDCRPNLKQITQIEFNNQRHRLNIKDRNLTLDVFQLQVKQSIKKIIKKKGVTCFTTKYDNILMWSHYGEQHKGICLEFDSNLLDFTIPNNVPKPIPFGPLQVKYNKEYAQYNLSENNNAEQVQNLLLSKAEQWAYEEEYRYISPASGKHSIINKESLIGVYFGVNFDSKLKSKYEVVIRGQYPRCQIFHLKQDPNKYAITI